MPETWPTISVNYDSLEETTHRATLRAPFEAGYRQTRKKWTRSRSKSFALGWRKLPESDYNILDIFFDVTCCGGASSFVWTKPSGVTYTCEFVDDELTLTSTVSGYYQGKVKMRTV